MSMSDGPIHVEISFEFESTDAGTIHDEDAPKTPWQPPAKPSLAELGLEPTNTCGGCDEPPERCHCDNNLY